MAEYLSPKGDRLVGLGRHQLARSASFVTDVPFFHVYVLVSICARCVGSLSRSGETRRERVVRVRLAVGDMDALLLTDLGRRIRQ